MRMWTRGLVVMSLILGGVWGGCGCVRLRPGGPSSLPDTGELPKLPTSVWQPLVRTFDKQVRGFNPGMNDVERGRYLASLSTPGKTAVRVAIIDVVPENDVRPNRNVHHAALASVIKGLSCLAVETAACGERVHVVPTRTRREDEYPNLTVVQMADAVKTAVASAKASQQHLVINFAVGLDPIKLGLNEGIIQPLTEALTDASCQGALILAPAGNVTGSEGPLLPASFEVQRAPSAEICKKRALLGHAGSEERYAPLVYAVGALDGLDQRLEPSRRWAEPRLAAFGLEASIGQTGEIPYSFPLTGTSMASAIVAGVAAAVWSAKPEWDAHKVMAHVYAGGVALDGGRQSARARTEFCLGSPFGPCADPVRRVNLCGALASAFPERKKELSCAETPSVSVELPVWPGRDGNGEKTGKLCLVTGCGIAYGPTSAQTPDGAVAQQPISGCPGCGVEGLVRVRGILQWGGPAPVMSGAVLRTWDSRDNQINSDYNLGTWTSDQNFDVTLITAISPQARSAAIGVNHDGKTDWVGIVVPK